MRTAKCHPQLGWLRLEPYDYSCSLDHLLACRDRDSDLTRSGPSPEYISWMWSTELPGLMRKEKYRDQVRQHCSDLARKSEELDIDIRSIVGSKLEQQAKADELRAQLTALLDE